MRRLWFWAAIAARLMVATAVWPIQTTIGDRQIDLDGTLRVREVVEENGATTHERTQQILHLRAAAALTGWLRFDSITVGTNGGPTLKSDRAGIYAWDDVFQDFSPAVDFEEAYFDVVLPSVDLRIGKQEVAWGKLDRTQPNDFINPLSYADPLVQDEAERKLGVPALQASYYLPAASFVPPESRLTAVWVPKYIPYRFPLARCDVQMGVSRCDIERWFPPAGVPVQRFDIPAGLIPLGGGASNPALSVPVAFRTHNAALPAWRLGNSEVGVRYSAIIHDVDFALYYFHGFDPQPAFNLTAEAFGQPDLNPANPLHVTNVSAGTLLSPEFHRINAGGADVAYAFHRFTVRGEGAFISDRPFARDLRLLLSDPRPLKDELSKALGALAHGAGRVPVQLPDAFVIRDAVEWGVGADYTYEGYILLFQMNQTDVLHNDVDLLIKDVETRLLANLRTNFLSDTLQTQVVAVHAIESDYTVVRPRLRYRVTDNLAAEAGYLFVAGRAHSLGGQYRRNDEGWLQLEYKL